MGTVSITLPQDGTPATVSQYNTPLTTITTAINGNLDSSNISSLNGSKLVAGSVPGTALDTNLAGGWNALSGTYTYGANNGNKEFTVTTPSDVTASLSAGMKMRFTRGTTAPTQSMAFTAASSQYASKASPIGITFTSAFTVEAWVYLNSYTVGGIIGRDDGTNGWGADINASGQLEWYYRSGSGLTQFQTYQSIPLKRWVHVALVVTSTGTKTAVSYINGTSVPFATPSGVATSLVQGTAALQLSKLGATTNYFDGYISEARIWSVAQSQANIQANMALSLAGSETNLVALFQGNGNFNDKTTNANNLTASGGAIATQTANPYNNIEYSIVTKAAYSSPNTTVTLSTGDSCSIPSMTLNSAQYSTAENPYGLPNDLHAGAGRRLLYIPINAQQSTTATSTTQFPPVTNAVFTVPSNCSKIYVNAYNVAVNVSGVGVLQLYNGTISAANIIGQANMGGNVLSIRIPVDVIPGSTFTLNAALWSTSAGTTTWNGGGLNQNAIWTEAG